MNFRSATALMCLMVGAIAAPHANAQWQAHAGAQNHDMGRQALAFFPNEMWIHAGDGITWTFDANEIHTVTFLVTGEVQPPFPVGCPPGPPPGITPDGSSFDGTSCVNAGPSVSGQTYTVNFPVAGNFKLICLVHPDMTGTVHVLDPSLPLPHNQAFYDDEAADMRRDLLHADVDVDHGHGGDHGGTHAVTAGAGVVSATPGGHQTLSIMRFMQARTVIHVGDTVEWNNADPVTPHTITFGTEPADPIPPSGSVPITVDPDGALHATLSSPTTDSVHSGFIMAESQIGIRIPQAPLTVTRFRVTFAAAGTYPFICALHDDLGMTGQVIVRP